MAFREIGNMITVANLVTEYDGLKDDTKPIDGVRNGSIFVEMDTATIYMFDEENGEWLEQSSDEGSGT